MFNRSIVTPIVGVVAQLDAAVKMATAESGLSGVGTMATGVVPAVERDTNISHAAAAAAADKARIAHTFNDRAAGAVMVSESAAAATAVAGLVTVYRAPMTCPYRLIYNGVV